MAIVFNQIVPCPSSPFTLMTGNYILTCEALSLDIYFNFPRWHEYCVISI